MKYTDEELSAYLDGELPEEKAAALTEALAQNPLLKARFDRLRRTDEALRAAYDPIARQPLPARLLSLFERIPIVARDSDGLASLSQKGRAGSFVNWQTAIAASIALAIGVGLGNLGLDRSLDDMRAAPQSLQLAAIIAPGDPLFDVLETVPSGDETAFGEEARFAATPILSFRSVDDRLCRELALSSETAGVRAVACRADHAWETMLAVKSSQDLNDDQFRPAAADPVIDGYLDKVMAGDALGAEDERKFIEAGWAPQGS